MSFELPQEEHEIEGVRFRITKLPFKAGRAVFLLLSTKILPSLKSGLADVDRDAGTREVATAVLAGLGSVFERLSEADLEKLDDAFGKYSEYAIGDRDGGEERWVRLDEKGRTLLFGGGKMALYTRWLMLCVKVNFADFFAALKTDVLDRAS
jgi:hypothetical protein